MVKGAENDTTAHNLERSQLTQLLSTQLLSGILKSRRARGTRQETRPLALVFARLASLGQIGELARRLLGTRMTQRFTTHSPRVRRKKGESAEQGKKSAGEWGRDLALWIHLLF